MKLRKASQPYETNLVFSYRKKKFLSFVHVEFTDEKSPTFLIPGRISLPSAMTYYCQFDLRLEHSAPIDA